MNCCVSSCGGSSSCNSTCSRSLHGSWGRSGDDRHRKLVGGLKEVEHLLEHPPGRSSQGVEPADDGQHTPDAVLADWGPVWGQQAAAWAVLAGLVRLYKAQNVGVVAAACEAG